MRGLPRTCAMSGVLAAFLRECRRRLPAVLEADAGAAASPVVVVLGNESADLDSITCAVAQALQLHLRQQAGRPLQVGAPEFAFLQNGGDPTAEAVVLPVVNTARADFPLRTEVVYMFQRLGLGPEDLIFAEDVNLARLREQRRLRLFLVDHNRLAGHQQAFGDCVAAIVDHHTDEGRHAASRPRTVELVGSCSTLVARDAFRHASETGVAVGSDVGLLLLSAILTDTVNVDASKGRCTTDDTEMVQRLLAVAGDCGSQAALYDAVSAAKFDVSALSLPQLLRKDYKQIEVRGVRIGVPALTARLEDVVAKVGVHRGCSASPTPYHHATPFFLPSHACRCSWCRPWTLSVAARGKKGGWGGGFRPLIISPPPAPRDP